MSPSMLTREQVMKRIVLIISWTTISPLFLFLTYRWQMIKKWLRWVLTFVSPLFLCIYFILYLCIIYFSITITLDDPFETPRDDKYYGNERRLEKITGVRFKMKKVVEYFPGPRDFMGDYNSITKILLKKLPDYEKIDRLTQKPEWSKTDNGYLYSNIWGPPLGLVAPDGVDNANRFLNVIVIYNCDTLYINSGMW